MQHLNQLFARRLMKPVFFPMADIIAHLEESHRPGELRRGSSP